MGAGLTLHGDGFQFSKAVEAALLQQLGIVRNTAQLWKRNHIDIPAQPVSSSGHAWCP
jgi:hypothetical protein